MSDTYYDATHTGLEIDEAVGKVLAPDATPTEDSTELITSGGVYTALGNKQATLVSGTNIKTVNSSSLLGSGDIAVQATLVSGTTIKTINSSSLLGAGDIAVQATLVSGTNIKTINSSSLLGSGNIDISGGGGGIPFGVCSTAASTTAKTVNITGVTELTEGLAINVLFTNSAGVSAPTLNVNSLGAKNIKTTTTVNAPSGTWNSNELVTLVFYGDAWLISDAGIASVSNYGYTMLSTSTSSTATNYAATPSAVKAAYDLANGKQDALTSGTNIKTVGGQTLLASGDVPVALPIVAQASIAWNTAHNFGTLSANKSVTLPALPSGVTGEIRLTATQGAGNSYKITLTAPTGVTITDGDSSGSSLEITPTAGKHIEISAAVVDTVISVLTNEV